MTVHSIAPQVERPLWRTVDIRAEDLEPGDVTRNKFGKWDVVTSVPEDSGVARGRDKQSLYIDVTFETGTTRQFRRVALVKIQQVKNS